MKVSALILTFNESVNIRRCMESLSWCDDIVVLDSGSTDDTIEIATRLGARIVSRPFDTFSGQRNFALETIPFKYDWILHLDADEELTPDFVAALATFELPDSFDGARVPSKTILLGQWLKYAGMYPTYQVRIGHVNRLRFMEIGHGQRETSPPERIKTFPIPYLHYNFSHGLRPWLDKHVRYAAAEASERFKAQDIGSGRLKDLFSTDGTTRRRSAKALSQVLPITLRPFARFLYVYVWRRGFLDGAAGLMYAFMMAVYEGMISILIWEHRRSATPEKSIYRD
jgi:hypothetical protein